ncbi:cytochrome P450 [Aspergillus campestris IBT 28561]|uniref:Cytochrome P450 n=1 Tax=Aspergillus campestris (strain IBT 28561) TaxID=1392248 RepID=A0A2I1D0V4_ASPC2|nr:cytochrome P450 [Aspergillus campestris IBT 28561]PKY03509.1 cytochrome P450 [Aspergillus campestris IBT 28561]
MGITSLASVLLGLAVLYVLKQLLSSRTNRTPLPPGPKGKFLIGNLGDLPPPGTKDWEHWAKFKESYGPISSITILGQTIVIINDARTAFDLMEKRSAIYSSRPRMTFAGELIGWDDITGMQPYSDSFRTYRKVIHRVLGSKATAARFNPLQEVEIRRFLLRVLDRPDDLVQHIRTEAGAVILKIAYGYTIEPHGRDPLVDMANDAMEEFSMAATPGVWLVDTIPWLKHLPGWLPGTGFKKTAAAWRKTLLNTIERPYRFVEEQMSRGTYAPSYVASLLEEDSGQWTAEDERVAKWTAASLYLGGADTTVSSLACFFLAIARNPDAQRKAQEEIDRVVGVHRLPTYADREKLPYIDALVKETLRWHPVAPMALPHACIQDDMYSGYRIPKGSLILPNIWAMTHDPAVYPDPMEFRPERFLGPTPELNPHTLSFGFGRRICPGKLLADNTIFLSIVQSLAVFNVSKLEGTGEETGFLPGVVSHPEPFQLRVRPRSEAHETLIRTVEAEHPWEESHAKEIEKV